MREYGTPQPEIRDARERRRDDLRKLEQEFDRLLGVVEDEGTAEGDAYRKALRGGPMPEETDAGALLNETYRKICGMRLELADERPPAPRKRSSIDHVVGIEGVDGGEAGILQKMEERFSDQDFERYEGREREKTERERRIVALVDGETNALRRKYGLPDLEVPAENFHLIPAASWDTSNGTAYYSGREQAVAMRETTSDLGFAKKVFHEMIHFKSYGAVQRKMDTEKFSEYRTGLVIHGRRGDATYFRAINEAVTEELTKRAMRASAGHELFRKDIEETQRLLSESPNAVDATGQPFFNSDTFFARRLPGNAGDRDIEGERFTYVKERKSLRMLAERLHESYPDRFPDAEAAFDAFAKAMLTGNILPIGRAIDRAFGSGTFRRVGEIEDPEELLAYVASL